MTGGGAGRAGTLVVDAANVVGARPDGWWRDRAGAAARLLDALAASVTAGTWEGRRVVVVLEGAARAVVKPSGHPASTTLPPASDDEGVQRASRHVGRALHDSSAGRWPGVDVVLAERDGDSAVVEVVAAAEGDVVVVTSDRELRRRVESLGADVRGAGWLRDVLDTLSP